MIKKKFSFIIIICTLLLLSGCFCEQCPSRKNLAPCGELIDSLRAQGVQIIQLGDTLRIILPVHTFFDPPTSYNPTDAVVKDCRDKTLKQVAELTMCWCYAISPITVSGYTDTIGSISDQKLRTKYQAQAIAAYLWGNGVPLKRMRVRWYGARGSISGNGTPRGEADNRRVEITLP